MEVYSKMLFAALLARDNLTRECSDFGYEEIDLDLNMSIPDNSKYQYRVSKDFFVYLYAYFDLYLSWYRLIKMWYVVFDDVSFASDVSKKLPISVKGQQNIARWS